MDRVHKVSRNLTKKIDLGECNTMSRLLFQGKATQMIEWLKAQLDIYGNCTVAEFIADSERHARAIKAIEQAGKAANKD